MPHRKIYQRLYEDAPDAIIFNAEPGSLAPLLVVAEIEESNAERKT